MRRGSFIGPLILIFIGGVFLLRNIRPDVPLMDWLETYWPALLIVWGGVRLLEIGYWYFSEKAMPQRGVTGGEWVLILVLVMIGSAVWGTERLFHEHFGPMQHGIDEMFGESHDYDVPASNVATGKTPRVIVNMARGSLRVTGAEAGAVNVSGRKNVRAMDQAAADRANSNSALSVQKNGETVTISAKMNGAGDSARISSDLEVSVPKGATLELHGQYGDFDISDVNGEVSVDSDNAGVRAQNLGGALRVETRKSDIIRATGVQGDVEVKGRGRDVELENIQGQVTINGSYSGETTLHNIARPVRFMSNVTEVRLEKVPGELTLGLSAVTGSNLTGPVFLKTQTKDIRLTDVSDALTIDGQSGDVEVNQTRLPVPHMDVHMHSGDIELALPAAPHCTLNVATNHGSITNDFDEQGIKQEGNEQKARLAAVLGGATEVKVATDHGNVTLRKSEPGPAQAAAPPAAAPVPPARTPKGLKAPKAPAKPPEPVSN
ncbi:MAG: DUF4097 family beta strand repeat-containing protein [Bryobacteraceae bacterium]